MFFFKSEYYCADERENLVPVCACVWQLLGELLSDNIITLTEKVVRETTNLFYFLFHVCEISTNRTEKNQKHVTVGEHKKSVECKRKQKRKTNATKPIRKRIVSNWSVSFQVTASSFFLMCTIWWLCLGGKVSAKRGKFQLPSQQKKYFFLSRHHSARVSTFIACQHHQTYIYIFG